MRLTRFVLLTILFSAFTFCAVELFRLGAEAGQQQKEVKINPKTFDLFVGQYSFADNPDLVLSFFREGDKFFLQATNQGRIEIFPQSETKFFLKLIDADATFVRDAQGKVTSVLWRQSGQQTPAKRTSNQPAVEANVEFARREEMIRMRDG
ncbi:MAG TPA: DUF3471 domain-containing protein, partial [Pyrinomonadaceae bacterium]